MRLIAGIPLTGMIRDNIKVFLFHGFSKMYAAGLIKIKMGLAFQRFLRKC